MPLTDTQNIITLPELKLTLEYLGEIIIKPIMIHIGYMNKYQYS